MGVWARGACKKLGPPIYFCNHCSWQLQIWYTTWVWAVAHQKTTFTTKIGGGPGEQSIQKIWDPLLISATVEASNFKFGMQLGFGE